MDPRPSANGALPLTSEVGSIWLEPTADISSLSHYRSSEQCLPPTVPIPVPGRFPLERTPARGEVLHCPFTVSPFIPNKPVGDYYGGADSSRLHRAPNALLSRFPGRDFREASLGHSITLFGSSPCLITYGRFHHSSPCCLRFDPRLSPGPGCTHLGRLTPRSRHLGLIPCLPSLQHRKTDLNFGLRPFPRPPHGVASNLPLAITFDGIDVKGLTQSDNPAIDLLHPSRYDVGADCHRHLGLWGCKSPLR